MSHPQADARLNDLLVEIHRSLVQYTQDVVYPWTPGDGMKLKEAVQESARDQESIVKAIVDYLIAGGHRVDFGVYPHDYSSLHFVSIDYLASQLLDNARAIASEIESALPEFADGTEARELAQQALTMQQQCVASLEAAMPTAV